MPDVRGAIASIDLSARFATPAPGKNDGGADVSRFSGVRYVATASRSIPGGPDQPIGAPVEGGYEVNFDNAPVQAVAKSILGDILQVPYALDPRVQGNITVSSGRPLAKKEMLFVFESALRMNEVALLRDGPGYKLVPISETAGGVTIDSDRNEPGFGMSVLPLRYVSATNMQKLMEGFATKPNTVRIDPSRNLMIFQGTGEERDNAMKTALSFDADFMRGQAVGIFPVRSGTPETVISELDKIMATGDGGIAQGVVKFEPIARLNAVMVIAHAPAALNTAATWIARLDRADPAASPIKVYQVKYGDAKQLAAVLNDVFSGRSGGGTDTSQSQTAPGSGTRLSHSAPIDPQGAPGFDSNANSGRSGSGAATPFGTLANAAIAARGGGATGTDANTGAATGTGDDGTGASGAQGLSGLGSPPSGQGSSAVHVTADTINNTLLINANRENYAAIERVLRTIDHPPLQVAIEATIAEVSLTDALQYGVQTYLKSADAGLKHNKGSAGFSDGVVDAAIARVLPGFNLLLGPKADPIAILSALRAITDVKLVSSPSLMVLDNQIATLQVGDEVPITTRSASTLDPTGLTNSATVINNIDYRNTGVILRVVPRVNANGNIQLDVEQEISNIKNNSNSETLTPTVSQRKLKSSIAVASGQTVMLGGLISERQEKDRNGVPGIESIRFLGDLFSATSLSRDRTELVIFIKPQIIRDSVDAQIVAEDLRSRILDGSGTYPVIPARPIIRK